MIQVGVKDVVRLYPALLLRALPLPFHEVFQFTIPTMEGSTITHCTQPLLQEVGAVHFEYVTLRVTVSDKHLVILGLLWLESHCL